MKIQIDKAPRCIWHTDCPENKWNSGIVQELKHDNEARNSLVRCLDCGAAGHIPYGSPFDEKIAIEDACQICAENCGKIYPSHRGSSRCESGSIASGGNKTHCTCDICF